MMYSRIISYLGIFFLPCRLLIYRAIVIYSVRYATLASKRWVGLTITPFPRVNVSLLQSREHSCGKCLTPDRKFIRITRSCALHCSRIWHNQNVVTLKQFYSDLFRARNAIEPDCKMHFGISRVCHAQ